MGIAGGDGGAGLERDFGADGDDLGLNTALQNDWFNGFHIYGRVKEEVVPC